MRSAAAANLSCLVGVCEASPPAAASLAPLCPPPPQPGCGLFAAAAPECVSNPRVGRWFVLATDVLPHSNAFDVLVSDPDVAFIRSPLGYFATLTAAHPLADVFFTSDANTGAYAHAGVAPSAAAGAPNASASSPTSAGGVAGGGAAGTPGSWFHSMLESPAGVARVPPLPPRWSASFPGVPVPSGYVFRPEHAARDRGLGVDALLASLARGGVDIGLEDPANCSPHSFNTGLSLWAGARRGRAAALLQAWLASMAPLVGNPLADDQAPLNAVARNGSTFCDLAASRSDGGSRRNASFALCGADRLLNGVGGGAACVGLLNVVQFANGFVYSTSRAHEQHGVAPFLLHATYASDKVMKLREEGLFLDPPGHYDGTFLTYDFVLPPAFLGAVEAAEIAGAGVDPPDGTHTWRSHWHLVSFQLRELRAALAVATALGRTLMLPRIACSCEARDASLYSLSSPHTPHTLSTHQCFFYPGKGCVIEGHRVRLPHVCPTDHWLRPGRLGAPHREPGFLDTPRTPRRLTVRGGGEKRVAPCADAGACEALADSTEALLVPANSSDGALRAALAPIAWSPVIRLTDPSVLFGGFDTPSDASAFAESLVGVLGAFCCVAERPGGANASDAGDGPWKVPYTFDGEPKFVRATADVGKCGA